MMYSSLAQFLEEFVPFLIGVGLDEQWSYCAVGGVKEPGQSEEGGQVQLRQEAVQLVKVVGNDRRLKWVGRWEQGNNCTMSTKQRVL